MRVRYIIGGTIMVLFFIWGTSAFLKTTIQYVSIEEARHSRQTVQVMGRIDFDRVIYDVENSRLKFSIYDAEAADPASAPRLDVVYTGVVPGNFEQATTVVLKGKSSGDVFMAEQMLVKCPSKYQGSGQEYQDINRHWPDTESGT